MAWTDARLEAWAQRAICPATGKSVQESWEDELELLAPLLRSRLGGEVERTFVASVAAAELAVEELRSEDLGRAVELLADYPDIGFVDATVAAMAERLKLSAIVTTDRRHFAQIRPRHRDAFELLPP